MDAFAYLGTGWEERPERVEAVVELLPPLPLGHHVVHLAAAVGVRLQLPCGGAGGPLRHHGGGEAAAPDGDVAGAVVPAAV